MQEVYFLGQVMLAALLGGILGWQRVRQRKSAGMRTYALVAAGSALFTILSRTGFGEASQAQVASTIVVGIGFLGAGTIFHKPAENHTEGLTTAAGLWVTAALGMAVALEFYVTAILCTAMIFCLLIIDDRQFIKPDEKKRKKIRRLQ